MISISAADIATLAAGKPVTLQGPPPIVITPPPVTVPPAATPPPGAFVLYADGKFAWPGSYSFGLTANYKDTTGKPATGTYCMECDVTSAWGGWLPYAPNWDFMSAPYHFIEFDAKASGASQLWNIYGVKVGDISYGLPDCRVIDYGPTPGKSPPANVWQHYKVPLAKVMSDSDLYKFCIQDKTGLAANRWWLNNVWFSA